jgi:hypothetical protein
MVKTLFVVTVLWVGIGGPHHRHGSDSVAGVKVGVSPCATSGTAAPDMRSTPRAPASMEMRSSVYR